MRFSFTLACLAAAVIIVHTTNPEEVFNNNNNRHQPQDHILEPLNFAADRETVAYLLPRLAAKYRPDNEWSEVTDPRFYMLTDMENEAYDDQVSFSLEVIDINMAEPFQSLLQQTIYHIF